MTKELDIQGRIIGLSPSLSEAEFWHQIITFIETNGFSFGGGLTKEKIAGCISDLPEEMTQEVFEKIFASFLAHNGWSFAGTITTLIDGVEIATDGPKNM